MTVQPDISICIPAYSMGGVGVGFLEASFVQLARQTHKSFDVIVSDQSDDMLIADLCVQWESRLNLRRIDSRSVARQSSANCNAAMQAAKGQIIKVLFQDDILASIDALHETFMAFQNPNTSWMVCGSGVTRDGTAMDRPMVPRYHPQIHFGKNTVSSPSVLAVRRDKMLEFDVNLIWLMDVDMYQRYAQAYGAPYIVGEPLILNRLHNGQVSAQVTPALRRRELRYVREKFKSSETLRDVISYYKQLLKAR